MKRRHRSRRWRLSRCKNRRGCNRRRHKERMNALPCVAERHLGARTAVMTNEPAVLDLQEATFGAKKATSQEGESACRVSGPSERTEGAISRIAGARLPASSKMRLLV